MRMRLPVESNRLPWDSRQANRAFKAGQLGAWYPYIYYIHMQHTLAITIIIETGCEGPRVIPAKYTRPPSRVIYIFMFILFFIPLFYFFIIFCICNAWFCILCTLMINLNQSITYPHLDDAFFHTRFICMRDEKNKEKKRLKCGSVGR